MRDEVRVMLRRAEDFFKDAEEDFKLSLIHI